METDKRPTTQSPKVQKSLNLLEEAQGLINEAASELSSVDGFADQWSELGKLYDQVKATWHLVDQRQSQLRNS